MTLTRIGHGFLLPGSHGSSDRRSSVRRFGPRDQQFVPAAAETRIAAGALGAEANNSLRRTARPTRVDPSDPKLGALIGKLNPRGDSRPIVEQFDIDAAER